MAKKSHLILVLLFLALAGNSLFAQPFDLLSPGADSPDSLSRELRSLQAIERDLSLERLTREPSKVEAFVDLGELRLSQGKLQEAQRFFEMALEIHPDNTRASQGLILTHYKKGEFNTARTLMERLHDFKPVSATLQQNLDLVRRGLKTDYQIGMTIREDDRGLLDIITSLEAFIPSEAYPKLSARYRYENWSYDDNGDTEDSQLYSATMEYQFDNFSGVALSYAPESFTGGESISGYSAQAITGSDRMRLSLSAGKQAFKENMFTVRNRLYEDTQRISLFGDLHKKTRISQSVSFAEISDSNNRSRYDTELMHFLFKHGEPFLSLNLRFYQLGYEKQQDDAGLPLQYWAPSDHKGAEFTCSWERSVGKHWWWGIEAGFITNRYKFTGQDTESDSGVGGELHLGYRFGSGNLYASIGDRLHDYFRERRVQVYGSFSY